MAERKNTAGNETRQDNRGSGKALWSAALFASGVLILAFTLISGESAWNSVHNIFLGMFGFSVFLVPVVLIYSSVMIALDRSRSAVQSKMIQSLLAMLLISAFVQIVSGAELSAGNLFKDIIPMLYSEGRQLRGGGVMSVFAGVPLLLLFGKTGALIIVLLLAFVFIMVTANKTVVDIFTALKNKVPSYEGDDAEGALVPAPKKADRKKKEAAKQPPAPVPNSDVPPAVVKGNAEGFNVDIPMPAGQELPSDPDKPRTAEEIFSRSLPQHPVMSVPTPIAEEAKTKIKNASEELDSIIRNAASGTQKKSAPASKTEIPKKHKQSTLASNKIKTDEELDMPETMTAADIQNEIAEQGAASLAYKFPPADLLRNVDNTLNSAEAEAEMKSNADTLVNTLKSFGVPTRIVDIHRGPTVTRYELQPNAGVKVSKITGLADDIAMNLAAEGVRIEAPIPGKAAVGIEVPNKIKDTVTIREMIESPEFAASKSKLSYVVGKNIDGETIVGDISKLPHMIIAGTTGSGKSVCTNSIIMSILYNASPDEVRLILIDPKIVEFKVYEGIPHLLIPVVTDPMKAAGALSWAVQEMLKRYKLFADSNVRDHGGYNEKAAETDGMEPLPKIVIIIDELADLMMAAGKDVEDSICRLAQMARAAGMHLIIATQRPTVDVVTGLIKANIPSRIALKVSSQVDSRTILDTGGAEKLLGYGDMLYAPSGAPKPMRVQGCYADTKEVEAVVNFIKSGGEAEYSNEIMEEIEKSIPVPKGAAPEADNAVPSGDGDIIDQAVELLVNGGQASVSYLQRKLKLGFARAGRVMDELEELGVVGPHQGSKPRSVLVTREMWQQRKLINQDNVSGGNSEE